LFCFIGASAPNPDLLFVLTQKVSKKVNPPAGGRFTRKTYAQLAETVQTRSSVAQTGQFLTPTLLVFRFTGRGHSLGISAQFNIYYFLIEKIYQRHYELSKFIVVWVTMWYHFEKRFFTSFRMTVSILCISTGVFWGGGGRQQTPAT